MIYANQIFDESFEQSYMNGCSWLNATAERAKGLRHYNGDICACGSPRCKEALPLPSGVHPNSCVGARFVSAVPGQIEQRTCSVRSFRQFPEPQLGQHQHRHRRRGPPAHGRAAVLVA